MTLEELLAKIPPEFKPIATEYGPVFVKWTIEEVNSWIMLIAKGDIVEAYKQVLGGMDNDGLLIEWSKMDASWEAANIDNKKKIELQRSAVLAILKVLLSIAVAMVGL